MKKYKISFGLNGFASCIRSYNQYFTMDDILNHGMLMGYDGVEFFPIHGESYSIYDPKGLREYFLKYRLAIPAAQTFPYGNAASPYEGERSAFVKSFRERTRMVSEMGGKVVHIVPPLWNGRVQEIWGISLEKALDNTAETYNQIADVAEKAEMRVCVEFEPPWLLNSVESVNWVLDKVGSKSVGVVFDFSHANVLSGGKPIELLKKIKGRVTWLHITDNDQSIFWDTKVVLSDSRITTSTHLPFGLGTVNLKEVIEALLKYNYKGWWNIDLWEAKDIYRVSELTKTKLTALLDELL